MEGTDECQTNNQQHQNLTFNRFHDEIPRASKHQLKHLQNTMLRQINRLNISPKNFASKAIITDRSHPPIHQTISFLYKQPLKIPSNKVTVIKPDGRKGYLKNDIVLIFTVGV